MAEKGQSDAVPNGRVMQHVLATSSCRHSCSTGYPDQAPAWLGQAIAQATAPLYARIILLEQQVAAVSLLDRASSSKIEVSCFYRLAMVIEY